MAGVGVTAVESGVGVAGASVVCARSRSVGMRAGVAAGVGVWEAGMKAAGLAVWLLVWVWLAHPLWVLQNVLWLWLQGWLLEVWPW